ncbi:MAG: ice-binding family protein [Bacteroidia bacterium]
MKSKLFIITTTIFILLFFSKAIFGQAPTLGTAANFVLFTSVGAMGNTGISQLTGNVGTNSGAITGFGNVNGVMHQVDGASATCAADLLTAYNQLNADVPTFFPATLLGNGQILTPGVYSIAGNTTMNLNLILNALGNPNAVFIIQINGTFSTNANSKVQLINGALACNVFWKVEGAVSMASGTTMRGTVIANNGAITMTAGDTLEGRALSTSGAVNVSGVLAYTPIGCGSAVLTGPTAPNLLSTACYALFSSDGPVTNVGVTNVVGDIGTNAGGTTTGYNPLLVVGTIHAVPDGSTNSCATDLLTVYNYLNLLPYDIELLYPAQFGNNLVLTPHTYLMNAAVTFTDTLYLNAEGDANAVFVIKVNGAFGTSVNSRVVLINGAQSRNVYWEINGAVSINTNSIFRGTIICNNGAIDLATGVVLDGRALTTTGALTTSAVNVTMPPGCGVPATGITTQPTNQAACVGSSVSFSVAATGSALTYQWRNGSVNLVNGGSFSGVTTATLTINPVNAADTSSFYNVVIGGSPNDTSIKVSLKLNTAPTFSVQPSNQTVCLGSSASFSVVAIGTSITYQWRNGIVNLINAGNFSGVNTATLTVNPANLTDTSSFYNVVITGGCPPGDTSIKVSLKLIATPTITTQPSSETVCAGSLASFSVAATGTGIIYQWREGFVNLVNAGNFSGVNTATLTINPVNLSDTSSFYNVVISGGCPPADTSIKVSLMLNATPTITTQPSSETVCVGNSTSFSVATTGTGVTYQWRQGTVNLVNGGNISGVTTATLVINPVSLADASSNYNVIASTICTTGDTSVDVALVVNDAPNITLQPTNETICTGDTAIFMVVATGLNLTYQWRSGTVNLVTGGNVLDATASTLKIYPATISDTSSFYNVVITGGCAPKDTSIKVSLKINLSPSITTQPTSQTVCVGSSVSFSVATTGAGIIYQWRNGTVNLVNGGVFSGVNTATLVINPANLSDTSSFYNVMISGTCAPKDSSIKVSLRLIATPTITIQPASQTVCAGSSVNFSVTTTGTGLTYQWEKGTTNIINGGNISGATTATLTINPATIADTSSFYNVVINGTCLLNDTSIKVSLHVNPLPTVTANASTTIVCAGSSVTLTGNGATSYVWTGGVTDGVSFIPLSTNTYTVTGTNSNSCSNTATITVTVNMLPVAVPTSNSPVCIGSVINLSTPTIVGASYNWTGPNGFVSTNQNPSLSSATIIEGGIYSLTVSIGVCSSAASTISVIVNNCGGINNSDLSVVKTVNNTYPLIGNTVVFTITATNHGHANATGVIVGDTLENGYSYVSSTSTMGTYNPSTGIWTIGNLNNGASAILTVTVKVLAAGNYANTAIIQGSGVDTNAVNNISTIVTYPTDFFIPEGFSPNGDGINDLFVIRGIEYYPLNTFTIFNRWGDEVFSAKPYQSTWDGKSTKGVRVGGDDLPVGTYFYILDLGNGSSIYKGTIYLNK